MRFSGAGVFIFRTSDPRCISRSMSAAIHIPQMYTSCGDSSVFSKGNPSGARTVCLCTFHDDDSRSLKRRKISAQRLHSQGQRLAEHVAVPATGTPLRLSSGLLIRVSARPAWGPRGICRPPQARAIRQRMRPHDREPTAGRARVLQARRGAWQARPWVLQARRLKRGSTAPRMQILKCNT